MKQKMKVVPVKIGGKSGYDIKVINADATVQDYIEALDAFIEEKECYRSRNPVIKNCYGCNLCCQERIPVTLVDALKLSGEDLASCIGKYLHVYVEGRVVDITLGLDNEEKCRFLDREKGFCRNYVNRPLVCHTFVCCPSTAAARKLREEIVNAGEDELVRSWFKTKGKNGYPIIHEGVSPKPDIRDYSRTPFFGVTDYRQVKLKDICSSELWRKIYS